MAALTIVHGLIHLLGAIDGFGWADVPQLEQPISTIAAWGWLTAALLVTAAGLQLALRVRWWWVIGTVGVVVSQVMIATSWSDAAAGTVPNVVLAIAAAHGFAAEGPVGFRAAYRRTADGVLAETVAGSRPTGTVGESDLERLPAPVATYIRRSGAAGRPHVMGFRAAISGRIRQGPDDPWMTWTGHQTNTFGPGPARAFLMDATMKGLPADVLHVYRGNAATMRVKALSLLPIIDARGDDMTRAETVTLLNDMCVLAPAALVDAPISWTAIDDRHTDAVYTNAGHAVRARLVFDEDGDLVDFVSDDRLIASRDGSTLTPCRWSTPVADYRAFEGRRLATLGHGRWHPNGEPAYDYLDFEVVDITYVESPTR